MCELSVSCAPRKHLCKRRHWCTCCTLCELHVTRVVVVDAVVGLTLALIAHVVVVVFVEAILHKISVFGDTLYILTCPESAGHAHLRTVTRSFAF